MIKKYFFLFLIFVSFSSVIPLNLQAQNQGFFTLGNNNGKGAWFSLGGELEVEGVDSQNDSDLVTNTASTTNSDNSVSRFQVDRLMLKPKITLPLKDIYVEGELEFFGNNTGTLLKEAYVVIELPKHLFFKVGLDDRFFMNPEDRGTEIYPLNGTAFWRDEDVGFTFGGDHPVRQGRGLWYWRTSLTNGLVLREQGVGKNDVYFMLHDNRQINDLTKNDKEYGGGLGYKYLGEKVTWDFMAFGFWSKLRNNVAVTDTVTDIDFLKEVITGYTSNSTANWFWGQNFSFDWRKFSFFSQYIFSQDGKIERHGFYIQPALKFMTQARDYLNGLEFLYRFNVLNVKEPGLADNISTSSFTWDRQTHSVAFNIHIAEGALLRNEFHLNLEETGGSPKDVDNNEFLAQLEIRF